ncbi:hypothetical protein ACFU96_45760, partial [Streptomyces sp. NPDC057620]|uniref:hypothetical protein n=1 Tax=Streptomyces sp. NPDC057620 TaxID=3346185 RepID=UPI0036B33AC3
DMMEPADRAFAFDYDHSGKLDHLVLYRPGIGTISIVRNGAGVFRPVYQDNPKPVVVDFVGTATLVTTSGDARLRTPPSGRLSGRLEFSRDRSSVRIVELADVTVGPITGIPGIGSVTVTISRRKGEGSGTLNASTGAMTLPVGLHFGYDKSVPFLLGDSDVAFGHPKGNPLTTASVISPSGQLSATGRPRNTLTGGITLVGASSFTGGAPLSGLDCTLTLRGTLAPIV